MVKSFTFVYWEITDEAMALEMGQAIHQKGYVALTYTVCAEDSDTFFNIFFSYQNWLHNKWSSDDQHRPAFEEFFKPWLNN